MVVGSIRIAAPRSFGRVVRLRLRLSPALEHGVEFGSDALGSSGCGRFASCQCLLLCFLCRFVRFLCSVVCNSSSRRKCLALLQVGRWTSHDLDLEIGNGLSRARFTFFSCLRVFFSRLLLPCRTSRLAVGRAFGPRSSSALVVEFLETLSSESRSCSFRIAGFDFLSKGFQREKTVSDAVESSDEWKNVDATDLLPWLSARQALRRSKPGAP